MQTFIQNFAQLQAGVQALVQVATLAPFVMVPALLLLLFWRKGA